MAPAVAHLHLVTTKTLDVCGEAYLLVQGYRVKTAVVLTDKGRAVATEVFRRLRGTRIHQKPGRGIDPHQWSEPA
jgi:hypothetical protein